MNQPRIITFTSDFGTREYYVPAVKGVILAVNPFARIVDISHEIAPHDVWEASFTLASAFDCFPAGTIHLVVVDPGVGSPRRALAVDTERYTFVAPDNGVLTFALKRDRPRRIVSLETEEYFRQPVAHTFHGRDIFAPVTGWISNGLDLAKFGPELTDPLMLEVPLPTLEHAGCLRGAVVHVDRFGNLITNLTPEAVTQLLGAEGTMLEFPGTGPAHIRRVRSYSEADAGEVVFLTGSSGFFEIAMREMSAAAQLGISRGATVTVQAAH